MTSKKSLSSSKKLFYKEFACNGFIHNKSIVVSGDQRANVKNFFIEEGIALERDIKTYGG